MLELLHFRDSEKILKNKNMLDDVLVTMEYIDDVLTGSLYKRELLRMALDEMDWMLVTDNMRIIENRRYMWKGFKRGVAIEGSFGAYEYIIEGLARLQIGFDTGLRYQGHIPENPNVPSPQNYRQGCISV